MRSMPMCARLWQRFRRKRRVLVTAHDAFGYFGRAYGLEVRGIQGDFPRSRSRACADLENLIAFVVEASGAGDFSGDIGARPQRAGVD